MTRKPKILIWDLETSLMEIYAFSLDKQYHSHEDIIKDWEILCISFKWLGNPKIWTLAGSEERILRGIREIIEEADIIVHHNGDNFDYKRIQTRARKYGIPPFPQRNIHNVVDTYKAAKNYFDFSSNRLDYLGEFFGVGRKQHVDKELWRRIARGDKKAMKEMIEYNQNDVALLERVYLEMSPAIQNHPNMALLADAKNVACVGCLGKNLQKRGVSPTRKKRYQRYQCQDCGKWQQGELINDTE